MNRYILFLILIVSVSSCRSKKGVITKKSKASKAVNKSETSTSGPLET